MELNIYKCKCGGTFERVAFNSEWDEEIELWDCICDKCGKHSILDYPVEEE